jgi:hypothetical protein
MITFNHVALTYGVTGAVVQFFPPQAELLANGAPASAATYSVYGGTQSNDDTAKFSGTATLDAVSTTVDAASGYTQTNRQKVNLTATTSIVVGYRYLVTNANGQREIVVPTHIVSDDYILVEEPLCYDYASGATFKGLRHYFTIDATFIADASNINAPGLVDLFNRLGDQGEFPPFRVRWSYTTGSIAQLTWTTFDVVRQAAKTTLSIHDLRALFPDVIFQEHIAERGQKFTSQLVAAERDCAIDARSSGYDPDQIRDAEIWNRIVLQKWAVLIGEGMLFGGADIAAWLTMQREKYTQLFEKTIGTTLRAWIDTSSTGGISTDPPRQMWLGER